MLNGLPEHALRARAVYLAEQYARRVARQRKKLPPKTIDDFLREGPRTVGARTAGKCLTLLAMMFKYARRHRWMTYDPTKGVRKPKPTVRRVERSEILTPSEMRRLIEHAHEPWRPMLSVALYCGLRSGEIRGLQWGDIEWATHQLWVRRAADAKGEKLQPPKTDAGVRALGIPDHLVPELKRWKLAAPKSDLDLVFPNGAGEIENASNFLNRGLLPALRRAGIRRIDVHSLRHAFASLMIAAGVNLKALQIMMGHSSFRVTMDTYAHLVPGTRDVAVNRVAEIVLNAPELEPAREAIESGSKMVAEAILTTSDEAKIASKSLTALSDGGVTVYSGPLCQGSCRSVPLRLSP